MHTFSQTCDKYVELLGKTKLVCKSDEAGKRFAGEMAYDSDVYPVVYGKSDTTGEKVYEEFYIPGEKVNMNRFNSLGIITDVPKRPMHEIDTFFDKLETIFAKSDFTKEEVVKAIQVFIPNFAHEEKDKNLDEKM